MKQMQDNFVKCRSCIKRGQSHRYLPTTKNDDAQNSTQHGRHNSNDEPSLYSEHRYGSDRLNMDAQDFWLPCQKEGALN